LKRLLPIPAAAAAENFPVRLQMNLDSVAGIGIFPAPDNYVSPTQKRFEPA